MPRNYKRKSRKPPPAEELLHRAVGEVLCGRSSIRKAAEKFNLSSLTVGFYSKRHSTCRMLSSSKIKRTFHTGFSNWNGIRVSWILEDLYSNQPRTFTSWNSCWNLICYCKCHKNSTRVDKTYGKASEDWLAGFLIRNKSLSIRKPEQTSQAIARATGFNKPVVDSFYDKLQSLNTKHQF